MDPGLSVVLVLWCHELYQTPKHRKGEPLVMRLSEDAVQEGREELWFREVMIQQIVSRTERVEEVAAGGP